MAAKRFTNRVIEEALRESAGIYVAAAKALGCNRKVIERAVARSPRLQEVAAEIREAETDFAEGTLRIALRAERKAANDAQASGDLSGMKLTATIFTAKCHGKKRGWSERHEISGPDGNAIPLGGYVVVRPSKAARTTQEWVDRYSPTEEENTSEGDASPPEDG